MSIKLPYDQIAPEIDKLIIRMAKTNSFQELNELIQIFDAYLEATGWDNDSFDKEYVKRIDEGWEKNEEGSVRELCKTSN
jgi:hypothetical protein